MATLRERMKSNKEWIILFFLFLFAWTRTEIGGDDVAYASVFSRGISLFAFVYERYQNWSWRIFIDAFMAIIETYWLVFQIFMAGVSTGLCWLIYKYIFSKRIKMDLCFFLFLGLPMYIYLYAWGADSINYLMPAFLYLFTIVFYIKRFRKENIWTGEYIWLIISFIVAINQELVCAVSLGLLACLGVYYYIKREKPCLWYYIQIILNIVMFLFALMCPGTKARKELTISVYVPEFLDWSIWEKILFANISMYKTVVIYASFWVTVFAVVFMVLVWIKGKSKIVKVISSYPAGIIAVFKVNQICPFEIWPYGKIVKKIFYIPGEIYSIEDMGIKDWLGVGFWLLFILSILFTLFILYHNTEKYWILVVCFGVGYVTMLIMGFGPTLYMSGPRTATYMYVAFLIADLVLLEEIQGYQYSFEKVYYGIYYLLFFGGIYTYIKSLACML